MRLIRGLLSTAFHQQKPCEADRCLGGVAAGPKTVRACRFQSLQATKPKRFRPSILRRKVASRPLKLSDARGSCSRACAGGPPFRAVEKTRVARASGAEPHARRADDGKA